LREIQEQKYRNPNAQFGLNAFSDLSPEEFRRMTGLGK